jgi:hypothetical protein
VEQFGLHCYDTEILIELESGAIDEGTLHELLRSFIGMKNLSIDYVWLLEELSRALQVGGVGSDPGFLPNLRYIFAPANHFASFINARQIMGRPIKFLMWSK